MNRESILRMAGGAIEAKVMVITSDDNGEMLIAELTPQIPGQVSMEGQVQGPREHALK